MNIRQLNEKLQKLILNEMAINYGRSLGKSNNLLDAINKIEIAKQGHIKTTCVLKVNAPVTDEEIFNKIYEPIFKGVVVEKQYPITIVWGEPDRKGLEGHGICHLLQGHGQYFNGIKQEICKNINKRATLDLNKAILKTNKYKFVFALFNLNGLPEEAVLITGYPTKPNGRSTKR